MKKLLIVFLLTIIVINRSNSQGFSFVSKDNVEILIPAEVGDPNIYKGDYDMSGLQQESDSITIKKQRYYYHGHPVKNKELFALMKTNREANVKFQNSFAIRVVAAPLAALGGMGIGFSLGNDELDKQTKNKVLGISIGFAVAGITLVGISGAVQNKAIKIYNQGLNKTSFYPRKEIKIGFTGNGVGVNYRF